MTVPETVQNGDAGTTVFYVQYELRRARLLENPVDVDGIFGPLTEVAVKTFQNNEGIDTDGVVGPITWGRFLAHHPLPPTLQVGSMGDVVASLQTVLNRVHGQGGMGPDFETLVVDGDFGPKTFYNVRVIQKMNEIETDGIVGPQTWSAGLVKSLGLLAEEVGV